MSFERITYKNQDGIAFIQLNTPHNLNALEGLILEELSKVFDKCASDNTVKALVISGSGKGFSAGGDIVSMNEILSGTEEVDFTASMEALNKVAIKLRTMPKPVVASIHGPAAGAGFNLAMLCDFRIAADNATFLQAFVNLGLISDMGGIYSLTKTIGVAKTTELVMLGKPVKVDKAKELGLVTEVVKMEDLEAETLKFTKMLTKLPSKSLKYMKELINNAAYTDFENALSKELEYQVVLANTADFKEGVSAFLEKRRPEFKGE